MTRNYKNIDKIYWFILWGHQNSNITTQYDSTYMHMQGHTYAYIYGRYWPDSDMK